MNARIHADRWLTAWNSRDLDAIMACYTDDVDFSASTVVTRWGRPDGCLHGKEELRRHFARGLELAPNLSFIEVALLTNPSGYALLYQRDNGNRVLDVVELDEQPPRRPSPCLLREHPALNRLRSSLRQEHFGSFDTLPEHAQDADLA